MDKPEFFLILESSLLVFDNVSLKDLTEKYGIDKEIAEAGFNLCTYLKTIKIVKVSGNNETSRH